LTKQLLYCPRDIADKKKGQPESRVNGISWTGAAVALQPARQTQNEERRFRDLYAFIESDYLANGQKSFRNVRGAWEKHLRSAFGDRPLRPYDPELVQSYILARQASGAKPATINRELAYVRRMANLGLRYLRTEDEKLQAALMRWGRVKGLKERNVRQGYLRDSEYEALARETAKVGLWLRAMFECACTYGWRKGELLGLKIGQVDLEERTISLLPGETKNDDARTVQMTQTVHELLTASIAGRSPDQFVFVRRRSNRRAAKDEPVKDFRKAWEKATVAAHVPGLLFHDLRRTGVRNMRRRGIDDRTAMRIVGHRTHSMLYRYSIVDEEDLRDAVRKMEDWERTRRRLAEQQQLFEESSQSTAAGKKRPN